MARGKRKQAQPRFKGAKIQTGVKTVERQHTFHKRIQGTVRPYPPGTKF
jgi:hypothetical protein